MTQSIMAAVLKGWLALLLLLLWSLVAQQASAARPLVDMASRGKRVLVVSNADAKDKFSGWIAGLKGSFVVVILGVLLVCGLNSVHFNI